MEVGEQEIDYDNIVETLINTFGNVLSKDCLYSIVENCGGDVEQSANAIISITMDGNLSLTPTTESFENILCEDAATLNVNTDEHNILSLTNPKNDPESNRPNNISQSIPTPPENAMSYAGASQSKRQLSPQKSRSETITRNPNDNFWTNQLKQIIAFHKDGVRVLVILRGAPGSGKSYIAKKIVDAIYSEHSEQNYQTHILTTDDFFMQNGVYIFDRQQLPEAHANNQRRARNGMILGLSPVIIDNTNIELWEMQPYVLEGVKNGYIIEVVEPDTHWARKATQLYKKNTHNVPLPAIRRMLDNLQSGVTGYYLIKYFGYQYPPNKTPPVLRNLPQLHKETANSVENIENIQTENIKVQPQDPNHFDANDSEQGPLSKSKRADENILDNEGCSQSIKNDILEDNVGDTNFTEVEKYIEHVQKLEDEWENGDNWEDSSVNTAKRDECVNLLEAQPQRNKLPRSYITENLLPPGEDSQDWSKISKFLPSWGECSSVVVEPKPVIEKMSSSTCVELGDTEISDMKNPFKIITATSRDINETYVATLNNKIPEKWMLDKSTSTTNSDQILTDSPLCENLESHFLAFRKMFKTIANTQTLRDIFDNCCGDVNWAVDIVIDGMANNVLREVDPSELSDTGEEEQNMEHCKCLSAYDILPDHNVSSVLPVENDKRVINLPSPIKKVKKECIVSEASVQLRKQIEQNIVIPDNHYSHHCLKIKKIRRGEYNVDENKDNENEEDEKKEDNNAIAAANQLLHDDNIPSTSGLSVLKTNNDTLDTLDNANIESCDEDYCGFVEAEKTVNIQLGVGLVEQLDDLFGRRNMEYPPSVNFSINMPLSLLNEINALWTESMLHQLELEAKKMELMLKQDEEFARQVSMKQEELTREGKEPVDPEFQDVMDFDDALVMYHNNTNGWRDEEPKDLAAKLTREKLCNLFPDIRRDILCELLVAHHNNFQVTVEVLLMSTGRSDIVEAKNGVSKFIMQKEIERKEKLLQNQTPSEDQWPVLPKLENIDMNVVQKYRDRAEKHLIARNLNYQKAKDYYNRGKTQIALYYSDFTTFHKKQYEQANSLAAASLMHLHASNKNSTTIDLHYLRVAEAKESLDLFLDMHIQKLKEKQDSNRSKYQTLFVITGRGLHSNGKPKIKPAVMKRLRERGLFYCERNPGLLAAKVCADDKLSYQIA